MTEPQLALDRAAHPARSRPRWIVPSALATVLAVGLAAGLLIPRLLGAGSVSVRGEVHLLGMSNVDGSHDDCFGRGGFADLRGGAQVVITDASGTTVAVTSLRTGELVLDGEPYYCSLAFEARVPSGKGFYGVAVGHRDRVQVAEADLSAVRLAIG